MYEPLQRRSQRVLVDEAKNSCFISAGYPGVGGLRAPGLPLPADNLRRAYHLQYEYVTDRRWLGAYSTGGRRAGRFGLGQVHGVPREEWRTGHASDVPLVRVFVQALVWFASHHAPWASRDDTADEAPSGSVHALLVLGPAVTGTTSLLLGPLPSQTRWMATRITVHESLAGDAARRRTYFLHEVDSCIQYA